MKILSYITFIAAFAFGMHNTKAVAATHTDDIAVEVSGGHVDVAYNETSESITLRMFSAVNTERVMVVLSGRGGSVSFKEKVIVVNRGTILEIPMAELSEGNYFLRVKGTTLNYSGRFKKK